ncbi:conserved phage C-terminal domain-containing protein [Pediococcus claussenii]|uniref:conserved phage C-terminal domain-containing protein n=1 Tax=Pediococcus claussenii TaxID=187452 RepID=UPI001E5C3729|nr:conserved phage C-terminal domain-containing protein [Pediococcus claussenii]
MVNHKPNKVLINGKLVDVATGERITSLVKLSELWNADRKVIRRFLDLLESDNMISRSSSKENGTRLKVNNYADYQAFKSDKEQRSPHEQPQGSPHKQECKELKNNNVEFKYKEFFEYLNQKTGKSFKNVEGNRKVVRARLNEGYSKRDLKLVVDFKTSEWKNNPDMNKYLRPSTLFQASKFDNYLNEAKESIRRVQSTNTGQNTDSIKQHEEDNLAKAEERARRALENEQ